MSVDSTVQIMQPGKSGRRDAIYDWLQMLSGLGLVLFMWCHMILVSSVVISSGLMNGIAGFFERTYMAQIGGPLVFLCFLFHFFLAARKIPFRAEGQNIITSHARMLQHRDTWLWLVQVVTAMVILMMGTIHMWVVLTDLPITAAKSAARVQGGFWFIFYLILLPMVELHVSIGFFRIGVKWGIIKSGSPRDASHRAESILFSIFIVIGLITLIRFMTLSA